MVEMFGGSLMACRGRYINQVEYQKAVVQKLLTMM